MQEPLEEFLIEEKAKKISEGTLRKRKMVMQWLDEWSDKPVTEFERNDLRDFLLHLKRGGPCDGTVGSYMGQVSKLFEFLENEFDVNFSELMIEE